MSSVRFNGRNLAFRLAVNGEGRTAALSWARRMLEGMFLIYSDTVKPNLEDKTHRNSIMRSISTLSRWHQLASELH